MAGSATPPRSAGSGGSAQRARKASGPPGAIWAVVVAGGSGQRFGRRKQHALLGGRPVLTWAVQAARPVADGIVVVLPADEVHAAPAVGGADKVVAGGATRSASVRAGLAAVPADATVVLVHDAARPLASTRLFASVAAAVLDGAEAVVPVMPVGDTVKRAQDGRVVSTLDRSDLVLAQTPQGFRADVLRAAHRGEPNATDDSALAEASGAAVVTVPGDADNIKLTDSSDLERAEALIGVATPAALAGALRVGHGFDTHPFATEPPGCDGPLNLGGVAIEGVARLSGHSDGDALAHAAADALLGAATMPDIGAQFPDDDPGTEGHDSCVLLAEVVARVKGEGWRITNVDCTVVAQVPRLAGHLAAMAARLSDVVGAPVGVKATSPEHLGSLGRGEGIACSATALVVRG